MATVENVCSSGSYSSTTSVTEAVQEGLLKIVRLGQQEHYECQICSKRMAGVIPAQAHLKGTQHGKMLRNYNQARDIEMMSNRNLRLRVDDVSTTSRNPSLPDDRAFTDLNATIVSVTDALRCGLVISKVTGSQKMLTCTICDIDTNGDVPMEQHMKGDLHLKRMKRKQDVVDYGADNVTPAQNIRAQRKSPITPVPLICRQEGQSTQDSLTKAISSGIVKQAGDGDPNHLLCVVCETICTGEEPMIQHIQGKAHYKRLRIRGRDQSPAVVTSTQSTPVSHHRTVHPSSLVQAAESSSNFMVKQETVSPSFPSGNATIESKRKSALKSAKEQGILLENEDGFECLICDKFMYGEASVAEHMEEDSHTTQLLVQIAYEENIIGTTSRGEEEYGSSMSQPSPQHTPPAAVQACPGTSSSLDQFRNCSRNSVSPPSQSSPSRGRYSSPSIAENMRDVQVYLPNDSLADLFE